MEIDKFIPKEFWEISVELESIKKDKFLFKLIKQKEKYNVVYKFILQSSCS